MQINKKHHVDVSCFSHDGNLLKNEKLCGISVSKTTATDKQEAERDILIHKDLTAVIVKELPWESEDVDI